MPLTNAQRTKHEQRITNAIAKAWAPMRSELIRLLGNPPDLANVPASFWRRSEEEAAAALLILLLPVYQQASISAADDIRKAGADFDVTPDAHKQAAELYAQQRVDDIVSRMTTTTRERAQTAVDNLPTTRRPRPQDFDTVFGRDRAESIGVTETTQADSAGGMETAEKARDDAGVEVEEVWNTERDGKVCPICKPLDGSTKDRWGRFFPQGPPAHIRCRCWLTRQVKLLTVKNP